MSAVSDFHDALAAQAGSTLVELASSRPNLNVGDLRALVAAYPGLGEITLGQLVAGVSGGRGKARAKGRTKAPRRSGSGKGWNVRTASGRDELDAAVLEALRELGGKNVAAGPLRDKLGTTAHQLRTSLNRHIEAGAVTFAGKARGTRYSLS